MKTMGQRGPDLGLLLGRVALAWLFVRAAWLRLTGGGGVAHLFRLHAPSLGAMLVILCQLAAGILVLIGLRTRPAASVLIALTLGADYFANRFWLLRGGALFGAVPPFYTDLALCGGLLILAMAGPGRFSADRG